MKKTIKKIKTWWKNRKLSFKKWWNRTVKKWLVKI